MGLVEFIISLSEFIIYFLSTVSTEEALGLVFFNSRDLLALQTHLCLADPTLPEFAVLPSVIVAVNLPGEKPEAFRR